MEGLARMAVFARVVEARSFSSAAEQLGMSKSTARKHLAALEARLGVRLLNRTTRKLSVTEAGRIFYERCKRILEEAEQAELEVGRLRSRPHGLLRVNAPMSFGHLHIVPVTAAFLARYPEIRLDLQLDDRVVDVVGAGFDMTIRIARLPDSRTVARRLAPNRVVACAAPDYLARHGIPETPSDLRRHNCLTYTYLSTRDQWRFHGPKGRESVQVSGTFQSSSGDALRDAAVAGVGIVHLPTFLAWRELEAETLKPVLAGYTGPEAFVHALYPQPTARHVPPKVRVFVDFLAARFGSPPYWDRGTAPPATRRGPW
jgi:DNA-binding transcriptional LysR family regulator